MQEEGQNYDIFAQSIVPADKGGGPAAAPAPQPAKKPYRGKTQRAPRRQPRQNPQAQRQAPAGAESVNPLLNAPLPDTTEGPVPATKRNMNLPEFRLADIQTWYVGIPI